MSTQWGTKMIELSKEQRQAYDRFIRARDRVKLVRTSTNIKYEWIPHRDYLDSHKPNGEHHPLFEPNLIWQEYKDASLAWWAVEPKFRNEERMRMSRGDYGHSDSWEDAPSGVRDVLSEIKGS